VEVSARVAGLAQQVCWESQVAWGHCPVIVCPSCLCCMLCICKLEVTFCEVAVAQSRVASCFTVKQSQQLLTRMKARQVIAEWTLLS